MEPISAIATIMSLIGGAKSLFGKSEDPYQWNRDQFARLMAKIEKTFPQLRSQYQMQEAINRNILTRRETMSGATGGLPRNIVNQNINRAEIGSMRNLQNVLANLDQEKIRALESLMGMSLQMPPKDIDTSGEDLFSTGLQLAGTTESGDWDWLRKLFGAKTSGGPFKTSEGLENWLNMTNSWAVPKSL